MTVSTSTRKKDRQNLEKTDPGTPLPIQSINQQTVNIYLFKIADCFFVCFFCARLLIAGIFNGSGSDIPGMAGAFLTAVISCTIINLNCHFCGEDKWHCYHVQTGYSSLN